MSYGDFRHLVNEMRAAQKRHSSLLYGDPRRKDAEFESASLQRAVDKALAEYDSGQSKLGFESNEELAQ